jgi:phosphoribosylformylglycinamidine cyclo-ligase
MMKKKSRDRMTYAEAGVDIDAGAEAKRRIKDMVGNTFTPSVLTDIGSFGALYRLAKDRWQDPLLVSSCDGVGTKLKLAFMTGIHDTVGYDLVSHCVSDIMVQGAKPLFFLDYIACGHLDPGTVEQIVAGLVRGCRETGCALIGGETAEMPDFYSKGEYDLAGFIVGVVERSKLLDGTGIRPGDRLLGLPSLGLHTNGYSLARRLFFERLEMGVHDSVTELNATVGELLLAPHRSYFALVEPLLDASLVRGMAHITGGGITDNLPRILPDGTAARVQKGSWPILPLFQFIQEKGGVSEDEMFRTFNMGIGMILVVSEEDAPRVTEQLQSRGEECFDIGCIIQGDNGVEYRS